MEPNVINFSQGFSQKVASTSCYYVYARGNFCCLLITIANSLAPDQAGHFVGPKLFDTRMVLEKNPASKE